MEIDVPLNVPHGHCSKRNCKVGRKFPNTKKLNYINNRGYCDECYIVKEFGVCSNLKCNIGKTIRPIEFLKFCDMCLKFYCTNCYHISHKFNCKYCGVPDVCYNHDIKKPVCNICI
jgi:hypothetical protein